jgi:microcystin-dependent protein
MPGTPTPRLGYPTLVAGNDNVSAFPTAYNTAVAIADNAIPYSTGTLAARPSAPTVAPQVYEATDTGVTYWWDGLTWRTMFKQTGELIYSFATTHDGALLANGQPVSRTTYAALNALAAAASYANGWGPGDGSTTFNVPNLCGRAIVGAGSGPGLTARALGATGGEETHELLAAESGVNGNGTTGTESAAHTHNSIHGSSGQVISPVGTAEPYALVAAANGVVDIYPDTLSTETASHFHTTNARNADSAHNNMQPFGVANVFIVT